MRNLLKIVSIGVSLAACSQPTSHQSTADVMRAADDAAAAAEAAVNAAAVSTAAPTAPTARSPLPQTNEKDYVQTFRINYYSSCSREASSGSDALPLALSMQVCLCTIDRAITTLNTQQLREMDRNIAYSLNVLQPHIEKCTESELPKYMEAHPEFLREYVLSHPEILD